tara:strand:+ start:402 stop:650 length:249 start_codon:yes stop_codon:yes gene_type:complete
MKSLLDRIWTIDIYLIIGNRILFGIDGFYDRNTNDKECIGQIRVFLPFLYLGKTWGYTPSGLSLRDTKFTFGMPYTRDHIII